MDKFKGLGVAMITPFDKNGEVDYPALDKITEHLVSNGTSYLVVMGTTGENPTISEDDQFEILQRVRQQNESRLPIVFGIAGNNTALVLERIKDFDFDGVDAILTASPYYNKPNQAGIIAHYKAIADACPVPVILYNVPGRTGSMMSADTICKLGKHKNIIAVKEASGDFDHAMAVIENKPEDFMVISGDDAYTLPFLSLGMDGVISVIGNAYPKEFSQMISYAMNDHLENARYLHYKLLPLMNAIFEDGNPGGIKNLLAHLGLCGPTMRAPLHQIDNKLIKKINELTKSL